MPTAQQVAVIAHGPSLSQVFSERFANYAVAVFILMLAMLGASQLLIRFLLSQLNTLKDVMLHVEKPVTSSARVPLACKDEVGQMANAFNAHAGRLSTGGQHRRQHRPATGRRRCTAGGEHERGAPRHARPAERNRSGRHGDQ